MLETVEFEKSVVGYISEDMWKRIRKRSLKEARDILVGRKRDDAVIESEVDQFVQDTLGDNRRKPFVTYDVVVKAGGTVQTILEYARKGHYDLIVMGKKGQSAVENALMGSTARRVMHRAEIPVMVVPLPAV